MRLTEQGRTYLPCQNIANYLFNDNFLECNHYRCTDHKLDFETGLDAFWYKHTKRAENGPNVMKQCQNREDVIDFSKEKSFEKEEWDFRGATETPMTYIENVIQEGSELTIELKKLINPIDVIVRCYTIRASDLSPADPDGSADAWLRVTNGATAPVGDSTEHTPDSLYPNFRKAVEYTTQMPGCGLLKLEVLDYDQFSTELIGETYLDLEDRWFSKGWNTIGKKSCSDILKILWTTMADLGIDSHKIVEDKKKAENDGNTKKVAQDTKRLLLARQKEAKCYAQRKTLFKDLSEKLNNSILSSDDYKRLKAMYDREDKGKDQALDEDEVTKLFQEIAKCKNQGWYKRYFGSSIDFDGRALNAIWKAIDRDESGAVNCFEFLSWVVTHGKGAADLDSMLAARGFTPGMVIMVKRLFKSTTDRFTPTGGGDLTPDQVRVASAQTFKTLKEEILDAKKQRKKKTPEAAAAAPAAPAAEGDKSGTTGGAGQDKSMREMFKDELQEDHKQWTAALQVVNDILRPYLEHHSADEVDDQVVLEPENADGSNVFVDTVFYKMREKRRAASRVDSNVWSEFWSSRTDPGSGPNSRDNIETWCRKEAQKLQEEIIVELQKEHPKDRTMHLLIADYEAHREDTYELTTDVRMVITRQDVDRFIGSCGLEDNPQLEEPIKDVFDACCVKLPSMLAVSEALAILQAFMHACYRLSTEIGERKSADAEDDEAPEAGAETGDLAGAPKELGRLFAIFEEELVDKGVFTLQSAKNVTQKIMELQAAKTLKGLPRFIDALWQVGRRFIDEMNDFNHMMWCTSKEEKAKEIDSSFWRPFEARLSAKQFKDIDHDGDGELSLPEYLAWLDNIMWDDGDDGTPGVAAEEDAQEDDGDAGMTEMTDMSQKRVKERGAGNELSFGKVLTGWLRLNGWVFKGDQKLRVFRKNMGEIVHMGKTKRILKEFTSVVDDMTGASAIEAWFENYEKAKLREAMAEKGADGAVDDDEDGDDGDGDGDESSDEDDVCEPALCPRPFVVSDKYRPVCYQDVDPVLHKRLFEELLIDMDEENTVDLDDAKPGLTQDRSKVKTEGQSEIKENIDAPNNGRQLWLMPKAGQSVRNATSLTSDISPEEYRPSGKNASDYTSFGISQALYEEKIQEPSDDLWRMVAAPSWNALGILYDKARIELDNPEYQDPLTRDTNKISNFQTAYFRKLHYKPDDELQAGGDGTKEKSDSRGTLGKTTATQWIDVKFPVDPFVYPAQILFFFLKKQEDEMGDDEYMDLYSSSFRPDESEPQYKKDPEALKRAIEAFAEVRREVRRVLGGRLHRGPDPERGEV
eukprot:SAG22_NODE_84_length_21617_cov_48.600102_5_plen_1318_part_00